MSTFLQTSGPISLVNLNNFFVSPVSFPAMNLYYRGGARVPAFKLGPTVRQPATGSFYSETSPRYFWSVEVDSFAFIEVRFNNEFFGGNASGANTTSFTVSNSTLFRSSFVRQQAAGEYDPAKNFYRVFRNFSEVTNINGIIPSSGRISLNQFYGAERP